MVWGIVNFATRTLDRLDLKTGRRHTPEDGDRLFRYLALALNLGFFGLGAGAARINLF